jgi:hypothetical protein
MRHRISVVVAAAGGLVLGVLAGCGLEDMAVDEGGGSGPVCYTDSDCVPNGCCGRGTGAVHVSDAPDCRGVSCDGTCPSNMINCGCGIPVCRNNHCEAAFTSNDRCG